MDIVMTGVAVAVLGPVVLGALTLLHSGVRRWIFESPADRIEREGGVVTFAEAGAPSRWQRLTRRGDTRERRRGMILDVVHLGARGAAGRHEDPVG